MKTICVKYFQHISRIIQILQPNLIFHQKPNNFIEKNQKISNENLDSQLEKELEYLKLNIENLLRYCQTLESQNKHLKKNINGMQILQKDSYKIGQNQFFNKKIHTLSDQIIRYQNKQQNIELKQTRELYLGSLNKIHCLKNQVQKLKLKLTQIHQTYNNNDQTQPKINQKPDMFATNTSLIHLNTYNNNEIDLEQLLCHQQLDIEESIGIKQKQNLKELVNSNQNDVKINNKLPIIENLIQKGISYKETQSRRNKEFDGLNSIIEKYRSESKYESIKSSLHEVKSIKSPLSKSKQMAIHNKIASYTNNNNNKDIYLYR